MRIIEPSVLLVKQPVDPVGILRHIELCGRVCYKSEGKITAESYKGFIERVIKRGHEAVLEHGNLIVRFGFDDCWIGTLEYDATYSNTPLFLRHTQSARNGTIVSGNFRAWRDALRLCIRSGLHISSALRDLLSKFDPVFTDLLHTVGVSDPGTAELIVSDDDLWTGYEVQTHSCRTLWFTCDRGVSHEIVRHRPASYCQESTRYCNYAKDDFGAEITVIKPCFFDEYTLQYDVWKRACEQAEKAYFDLMTHGDCTPQQARTVLPNSLKTEVAMTANMGEWLHFLRLRCAEAAHPQMREVATRAKKVLLCDVPEMETWL